MLRTVPGRLLPFRLASRARFYSSESKKDPNNKISKANDGNNSISSYKSTPSSSAPAPMNSTDIDHLLKKDNKPYIPKLKHDRVSYEYPGLPNQDDFTKTKKPKEVTRWSRYVPKILTVLVVLWGGYTIKVWWFPPENGADSQDLLDENHFHKFIVSHVEDIDEDHFLIELHPKYNHWQYSYLSDYAGKSIWNGDRIWSVEVKQPEIMVVRSYTPLPLYFMKSEYTRAGERKPLLKVVNNDILDYDKQGVMCLYVKKYKDGEVSRYISSKKVGDEIELRGPHVEYRFPFHPLKKFHERPIFRDLPSKIEPEHLVERIKQINKLPGYDNVTFYAAGTGIAPILQVLLSRNPYRGFVNIHYSAQKPGELQPLERFLFFLEKLDRVKLNVHYDSENNRLSKRDVEKAEPSNYLSPLRLEHRINELTPEEALKLRMSVLDGDSPVQDTDKPDQRVERFQNAIEQAAMTSQIPKTPSSLTIVCGPDGYVDYVAGPKDRVSNEQGEVLGLLAGKNWNNDNVFKL